MRPVARARGRTLALPAGCPALRRPVWGAQGGSDAGMTAVMVLGSASATWGSSPWFFVLLVHFILLPSWGRRAGRRGERPLSAAPTPH